MKFCSLYSGSSGNCQFIGTDKVKILIDAGLSGKKIEIALKSIDENPADINAIFITHEHSDHVSGAGILSRRYNIPIYANIRTWEAMENRLGKLKEENIKIAEEEMEYGDLNIKMFDISHDAVKPVGYNIYKKNKKISLLTDTGCINEKIKDNIKDCDLLLIETNHDVELLMVGSYSWPLKRRVLSDHGHLSNETAAILISEILSKGNETVLLAHLSQENNFPELAYKTVANILTEKGYDINKDIMLEMTHRHKPSKVINL